MIVLALLPAVILLVMIYRADKIEKEPIGLLAKLFIFGVLTTISAMILETIGCEILDIFFYQDDLIYIIIENFFIVALAEEIGKYFVVKKFAWKHPAFNYTFDAVVYAVVASLGFAAFENIMYLTDETLSTALMRGVLAVPGHAIDAVFMGYYLGLAKRAEVLGDGKRCKSNLKLALWVPVFTHGFYDFCLSLDSDIMMIVFFVFEIFITIYAIKKIKKLSKEDTALYGSVYPGANTVMNMISQGIIKYDPQTGKAYYVDPSKMNFDPMTGERLR